MIFQYDLKNEQVHFSAVLLFLGFCQCKYVDDFFGRGMSIAVFIQYITLLYSSGSRLLL